VNEVAIELAIVNECENADGRNKIGRWEMASDRKRAAKPRVRVSAPRVKNVRLRRGTIDDLIIDDILVASFECVGEASNSDRVSTEKVTGQWH
jgi:hypothetical protein